MNKISSFQTAALALCFALARMIAFRPEGSNMLVCIVGEFFACVLLAVLSLAAGAVPPLKNGLPAKILAVIGGLYCLFAASLVLAVFADSMQYSFPEFYSSWAIIAALAAAAAYCASMGVSACGRTACAAVLISLPIFLFMGVGASDGIDVSGLQFAVDDRNEQIFSHFVWALGYSFEIPLLFMLRGRTDRPRRAAVIYSIGRTFMWSVMLALCGCVLGDHAQKGLPVFSLAAYSKTAIVERFDALVLLMWALCTLLALSMVFLGLGECVRRIKTSVPSLTGLIPAAITAAAACVMSACIVPEPAPVILSGMLLLVLIPAALSGGRAL
jgi:hypothetical protein